MGVNVDTDHPQMIDILSYLDTTRLRIGAIYGIEMQKSYR